MAETGDAVSLICKSLIDGDEDEANKFRFSINVANPGIKFGVQLYRSNVFLLDVRKVFDYLAQSYSREGRGRVS